MTESQVIQEAAAAYAGMAADRKAYNAAGLPTPAAIIDAYVDPAKDPVRNHHLLCVAVDAAPKPEPKKPTPPHNRKQCEYPWESMEPDIPRHWADRGESHRVATAARKWCKRNRPHLRASLERLDDGFFITFKTRTCERCGDPPASQTARYCLRCHDEIASENGQAQGRKNRKSGAVHAPREG